MKYIYSLLAIFIVKISFAQNVTFRIAYEPNSKAYHQVEDLLTDYDTQKEYSFAFTEERLQEMESQAMKITGHIQSIQNIRNTFDIQIHNIRNQEEEIKLLRKNTKLSWGKILRKSKSKNYPASV